MEEADQSAPPPLCIGDASRYGHTQPLPCIPCPACITSANHLGQSYATHITFPILSPSLWARIYKGDQETVWAPLKTSFALGTSPPALGMSWT